MRRFLNYPSIVATLALLVAMSGTAYAAATIRGSDVVNGSLTGKDLKNDSVKSRDVSGLKASDFTGALPQGPAGPVGPSGPGARMEASGVLSVPSGPDNTFEMDTEAYDTGGMYAAPDDFIIITEPGTYLVVGTITFGAASSQRQVRVAVNGNGIRAVTADKSGSDQATLQAVTTLRLEPGDQVSLGTFSTVAVPVSDFTAVNDAWLSVQWLAE